MTPIIAYYRVSTKQQGASGLGLEAQKAIVARYGTPVADYTEVETGKKADRPKLKAALAHAKQINATLVVAKLDRLARNVMFIASLMESGVDFIAADMPQANKLTIHIMAALAEQEATLISERTKAALQAAKARGTKLGGYKGGGGWPLNSPHHQALKQSRFEEKYRHIIPILTLLRERGETEQTIANELNRHGYRTSTDKPFRQSSVHQILARVTQGY
jgi:DNA invertase Pin-like site-specific DNA recombinase